MSGVTCALSIMQPWAWLIVNGYKDIENRTWQTHRTGRILIHAGKKIDGEAWQAIADGLHPVTGAPLPDELVEKFITAAFTNEIHRGGIVGEANITGCYTQYPSPWFVGPYGFGLVATNPLPFMPVKGALSFFPVDYRVPA